MRPIKSGITRTSYGDGLPSSNSKIKRKYKIFQLFFLIFCFSYLTYVFKLYVLIVLWQLVLIFFGEECNARREASLLACSRLRSTPPLLDTPSIQQCIILKLFKLNKCKLMNVNIYNIVSNGTDQLRIPIFAFF